MLELTNKINENKLNLGAVKERLSVEFNINTSQLDNEEPESDKIEDRYANAQTNNEEEIKIKVEKLRRDMESMGAVNPMAMEAYNEVAERNKFIHMAAFGHEKLAEYWIAHGRNHYAIYHLRKSIMGFTQWGAYAKVEQLKKRYADFIEIQSFSPSRNSATVSDSTDMFMTDRLDLMTIFKASQALSGILSMEELKKSIIGVVMECAGASRVALIVPNKSDLVVEILADVNSEFISESLPLSQSYHLLPVSVINYVNRKRESVLINKFQQTGFLIVMFILTNISLNLFGHYR